MTEKRLLAVLIVLFAFENLLYFKHLFSAAKNYSRVLSSNTEETACPQACQKLIDQKISLALSKLNKSTTAAAKTVSYLPLGSGGSTTIQNWNTVSGSDFSFDLKDYPTGTKVYWVGNLKTDDLNSRCYARIYDQSNFRAVDFSEQSTNKTAFENLTSQALSIWAGKNEYRLELKSLNGINCYLESPKLIIKQ